MDTEQIRNFCIIAHIDHGKSTLADRMLESTNTVSKREFKDQMLDKMDLERERGITIKLQPVRMSYRSPKDNNVYQLNLIDTPGHVDFGYEVSRTLAASEGAILVVDATQGIQAQTLANVYMALAADLDIIPVVNKIDLPAADPEKVTREIVALLGVEPSDVLRISAKTGEGVDKLLEAIVDKIKSPQGTSSEPLRALVFDSHYDEYRGVVLSVRVVDGELNQGNEIKLMATNKEGNALEVGYFSPNPVPGSKIGTGEIGYVVTNFRSVDAARVGDTVTLKNKPAHQPLPGYQEVKPFVFAGVFPASSDDYNLLKEGLSKLALSDAAIIYEPENSQVLGFGFRVGFLGLLHMDIVKERLEREYGLELIITNPSTTYQVVLTDGSKVTINSASDLPDAAKIEQIQEPWVKGEIVVPSSYVGQIIQLIVSNRGEHHHIDYIDGDLAVVNFKAPLANMLTDFYDELKSKTSGYGSLNYDTDGYKAGDLVRLDFLVAGERVDALSVIVHRQEAHQLGRLTVSKLKEIIPKQMFKVSLQAAIGTKIIARDDIPAMKKNVTGHLYGGDVSRKKKLWAKQAKGKARMKKFGKVDIPAETFMVMLKKN